MGMKRIFVIALLALAACSAPATSTTHDSSAPATTVQASTPKPSPPPIETRTASEITARANTILKDSLAITNYTDACGTVAWACAITDMSANPAAPTMLNVRVQDSLTQAAAKKTALAVWNFVGRDLPELRWVIVYDASGVVRAQMQRSEVPLLR